MSLSEEVQANISKSNRSTEKKLLGLSVARRASLSVAAGLLLPAVGCRDRHADTRPTFDQTVVWMQQALKERNGIQWHDNEPPLAKLTSQGCIITYEPSHGETIRYDLADVNPQTISVKLIGNTPWVTFDTRDFHRSVKYRDTTAPKDGPLNYDSPDGGFSLNSNDVAESFAKALTRAVDLCGGHPSTF